MELNENIKVGIIIPAYNVQDYIFRALDSCILQTYGNIEVVVVDDGSSDDTLAVAKEYEKKDSRVRVFSQKNSGVSSARNHALQLCTADLALFLDSDDWLETDAVESMLAHLPQEWRSSLVCCDAYYAYTDGETGIRKKIADGIAAPKECSAQEMLLYTSKQEYKLRSACYKLFSMEVISDCGLKFNEDIRHGEDGLFVFEYLKRVRSAVYFPKPLWNILERTNSATTAPYNKSWLSALTAVEVMMSYDNSPELQTELRKYLVGRATTVLCHALASGKGEKEDVLYLRKRLRSEFGFYVRAEKRMRNKLFLSVRDKDHRMSCDGACAV